MNNKKLTIVSSDDWEGLYEDGLILSQGHSLNLDETLNLLGYKVDYKVVDSDWLEEEGFLPDKLENLPPEFIVKNK